MTSLPPPGDPHTFTLGILGGGQLARMTVYAAFRLGLRVAILEEKAASPAGQIAQQQFIGSVENHRLLRDFASACDIITLENEFIPTARLRDIEAWGKPLFPSSRITLAIARDKLIQKQTLAGLDIPLPRFRAINTRDDAVACGAEWGYPFVIKARRGGYDGYGNRTVEQASEIEAALAELRFPENEVLAEAWVPFKAELAVMVARNGDGEMRCYPVVETVQRDHICKIVQAPAAVDEAVRERALAIARRAVTAVDGIGVTGVEMFLTEDGEVLLNEIAPRPHNSGHYTIEACVTSQFENHLRGVCGWPLGDTAMIAPAAVMVNLLGKRDGPATLQDVPEVLRHERAHLHIYGKEQSRSGRKMGHVTVLGDSIEACRREAEAVDAALTF